MRICFSLILIMNIFTSVAIYAQHDHHGHKTASDTSNKNPKKVLNKKDTLPHRHAKQRNHEKIADTDKHDHGAMNMSHAFSKNLPMTRNGSGTAWLPDSSPMYAYMFHTPKWMYMLHGNVFLRYNNQDLFKNGSRGGDKIDLPNMWMFMGQRQVGKNGLFHFSSMLSLDPITVGESGYPLLFQTGETYNGKPLIDRQHPHDLFSELSVSYAQALSPKSDIFIYIGYPGEPALGPVAFVHRPSGFFNPDAPLTHHWVDATHITFGVATVGYRFNKWKIEGSSFTGREPDENRYNFDKPRFDSWSGRLSYNPTSNWAFQVSRGFIRQPEPLHPDEDVDRTTFSAQYSKNHHNNSSTNITALWGMNKTKGHDGENGILLEGSHLIKGMAIYGRYEWVQKSAEELALTDGDWEHDAIFPVNAFTAGVSYDLFRFGSTNVAVGSQVSFYKPDIRLAGIYGKTPMGGQIYLRLYPMRIQPTKRSFNK